MALDDQPRRRAGRSEREGEKEEEREREKSGDSQVRPQILPFRPHLFVPHPQCNEELCYFLLCETLEGG